MPFYEKGNVRIAYEEAGKGFPLLIISGGGLNSTIEWAKKNAPFNAMTEFSNEYRVIMTDLRNAVGGQSTGVSGVVPLVSRAAVVTSLKVDPGGYCPAKARLNG